MRKKVIRIGTDKDVAKFIVFPNLKARPPSKNYVP